VAGLVNFKLNRDNLGYSVYSPHLVLEKNLSAINHAQNLVNQGVGELVLNSVDRDGLMDGYDINFLKTVIDQTNVAVTILGGAGSVQHFKEALNLADTPIGLAAGSFFTYRGKYKSVMFSYISQKDRDSLLKAD
jgi:cyclase